MEESIKIPEGRHCGKIVSETVREFEMGVKTIQYIDYEVALEALKKRDNSPVLLRFSFPARLTENSSLTAFLAKLDFFAEVGEEIETKDVVGKRISFMVLAKKKPEGTFSEVLKESIEKV